MYRIKKEIRLLMVATLTVLLYACPAKNDGTIEGVVAPPAPGIRISAVKEGTVTSTVEAAALDGSFTLTLPPGTYDVRVTAPSSPLPLSFPSVVVKPGETTMLPPIQLAPAAGNAALSGRIVPPDNTQVTLLYEGQERAAIRTSPDGRYEFKELPAGRYTLQATSPGYAVDTVELAAMENQRAAQNLRLLYITTIDGVYWEEGKIKARGIGLPPKNAPTPTIRKELAKRAAIADGQRNLLRIIEEIKVSPDKKLTSLVGEKNYTETLSGFIQGYRVASERDLDGGSIEVELELPLTGPGGLSSYIRDK